MLASISSDCVTQVASLSMLSESKTLGLHFINVISFINSFFIFPQVIKNPVSDHLPTGCPKYAMSYSAEEVIDVRDYVPKDGPAVFVIGAMAHGSVSGDRVLGYI